MDDAGFIQVSDNLQTKARLQAEASRGLDKFRLGNEMHFLRAKDATEQLDSLYRQARKTLPRLDDKDEADFEIVREHWLMGRDAMTQVIDAMINEEMAAPGEVLEAEVGPGGDVIEAHALAIEAALFTPRWPGQTIKDVANAASSFRLKAQHYDLFGNLLD